MEVMKIHKEQIKLLTEFIIEKSLIFHPTISPEGCPDFSNHYGKQYILIIDRNIMTKIVEICNTGTLKDQHISLLFWAHFNHISITGGLALNEYANNKNILLYFPILIFFYKLLVNRCHLIINTLDLKSILQRK